MYIVNLQEQNSVLNQFVSEIRNTEVQSDRMRFRKNLERIGEIIAYELSKKLFYKDKTITTPLGKTQIPLPAEEIVICSILRAGLPLHTGLLNYFDRAENSFISAYRRHTSETEFEIEVEYLASPSLAGKTLILADPMLASGSSFFHVYEALMDMGTPANIHLVSAIGARPGIEFLNKSLPANTTLWIAAIDEKLDDRGYIIPGLGDAGDLSFGQKEQH